MPDLIGKTLGKYQIVARLGRGGMAEVYTAYQANLDRHVAVKVIRTTSADDPQYLARFEREARSAAALRHPNIVQVYDYDVDPESGQPYMVMELVEGASLAEYLEQRVGSGTPLGLAETARIIGEVGAALAYAHQRGVIHRDVKPSNVMRENSGRLILTDFGLAKVITSPGLTTSGANLGTPAYMAPEQVTGQPADARADLYALGVILYQLLTGQLPHQAETPQAVMVKKVTDPARDPRTINPTLPEKVAGVVLKSLAQSPEERYQTVDELLIDLQAALTEASVSIPSPSSPPAAPSFAAPTQPSPGAATKPARTAPGPYAITLEIKPPPEPTLPPQLAEFVGRESELAYFTDGLVTKHLAVISGMPGVGKTALASELTRRLDKPAQTFWHSFHASEGVNVLIWKLAGFLAWHEQRDLWHTLQSATQTGSQAPPPEVLFDYLFQMVRGRGYVLCFDDFHFVDDDPLLGQFATRLGSALEAGEVDVVLTTQRRPEFVAESDLKPLGGLSLADTRALLVKRGLTVTDQLIGDLHAHTDGNAELVMLALDALRRSTDSSRLISRLSESEQVERFLVKEVDEGLSDEERQVMSAVAVLLGYAGTRDAVAAVLEGASVRRPLNDLVRRSLITVVEGESGREYSLNALVRAFYYDLISQRERRAMHRRAGEFYENEEPDALRAALHYQRCGEHARAVQMVTADVWAILNQGQARALRSILEAFTEKQLDRLAWTAVLLARGQVYALLGETPLAHESYHAALTQAEAPELIACACLGLAEVTLDDDPEAAFRWLRHGLEAAPDDAALRIRLGRALAYRGQPVEAEAELTRGLRLLAPGPSRWRNSALLNLGNLAYFRGEPDRALEYYQQAITGARELNDEWFVVEVELNLSLVLNGAGRWPEALAHSAAALELSQKLGSAAQRLRALLTRGLSYFCLGELSLAEDCFAGARQLALAQKWQADLVYANNSLAELRLAQGHLDEAESLLEENRPLAAATGAVEPLPDLHRLRASLHLARGQTEAALAEARRAVQTAQEQAAVVFEGAATRVLAQAQWVLGDFAAARESFARSFRLLETTDRLEAARTQLEWGRALRAGPEPERGTALLRAARVAFEILGTRRELVTVDKLLPDG